MKFVYTFPTSQRVVGLGVKFVREQLFETPKIHGFSIKLFLGGSRLLDSQQLQLTHMQRREQAYQRHHFNEQYHLFLTAYRCNLQACESQEHKDRINALYLRFLTKTMCVSERECGQAAEAITKLLRDLEKLQIYTEALPLVSDEQLAEEAFAS